MSLKNFQKFLSVREKLRNIEREATNMVIGDSEKNICISDFTLSITLGRGAFGKVFLLNLVLNYENRFI